MKHILIHGHSVICFSKFKLFYLAFISLFFISFQLRAQTAINDHFSTHIQNPVTINPVANDSGCVNYNLSIRIPPQHGTLSTISAGGSFTYTPNTGFTGKDSLQYTINCNGNNSSAWVYFTITPFPDNIFESDCFVLPEATQWGIRKGDSSSTTAHMCAQPFVGDIDNDGQNEVVVPGHAGNFTITSSIVIYNYLLREKTTFNVPAMNTGGGFPIAIADVDGDGIAEIFVHSSDNILRCYNFNGANVTTKWTASQSVSAIRTSSPVIADINSDGIPDIMVYNKIFNAQTGELEVTLPVSVGEEVIYYGSGGRISMPVFADMDNDGIQEVAGGNTVIKVNITNPYGTAGNNAYVWKRLTGTNIGDGLTSVADIDLDGFMDVIVVRSGYVYVWKPFTGINSSPVLLDIFPYNSSNGYCGSRALVADIDNDGYPEIAWTYAYRIQSCKYDTITRKLSTLWTHSTTDRSGSTVMSVFDFNQDGSAEIVYRDETDLRILDGVTGLNKYSTPCESGTGIEYPIIVDLDKDGAAEIIVSESYRYSIYGSASRGRIRSFIGPSGTSWAPARPVWNQYSYNVVHINNNLTVPQYQFNPVTVFTDPSDPSISRRPFNNFLQQATMVNQNGSAFTPAADITFIKDSSKTINSCDSIQIKLLLHNNGSQLFKTPSYITTYKDSYNGDIIKIDTIFSSVAANDSKNIILTLLFSDFKNLLPISNLVFALNNAGNGIAQNGMLQAECDTTNNLLTIPFPKFSISYHIQLKDTACQGKPYMENGFNISADKTLGMGISHYRQSLVSVFGCDSIIDLELNVLYPKYEIETTAMACHFYEWNGETYSKSGRYTQYLASVNGCDSIVHLNLTIGDVSVSIKDAICKGQAYNSQGFDIPVQGTEGNYSFQLFLKTQADCDSTVNLDLKVIDSRINIGATDSILCNKTITLEARTPLQYVQWSTGYTDKSFLIQEPGTYYVTAYEGFCNISDSIVIKPCCPDKYLLPNVITPSNKDGINDYFCLTKGFSPFEMEITIYNRLGRSVFHSKDSEFKWHGDIDGITTTADYFYVLLLNKQCRFQGIVSVF